MTTKSWRDHFETLDDYITAHGKPWTVGNTRGQIPTAVETALLARWKYDRLAIRKEAANYVARVTGLFSSIAQTSMYNVIDTYATRDELLGDGQLRTYTRTSYAAPEGDVDDAYITGQEVNTETLPMSEKVDRALAVQDGMKDAIEEAVRCFTFCFLGVL